MAATLIRVADIKMFQISDVNWDRDFTLDDLLKTLTRANRANARSVSAAGTGIDPAVAEC